MPDDLLANCRGLINALAPVLAAADLPATPLDGPLVPPAAPAGLPVLQALGAVRAQAPGPVRAFVERLVGLAPRLAWRQTYGQGEADPAFLRGYGWTELVGAGGLLRDPSVSAGLLLLGPEVHYPAHAHPALEHYLPLSGVAHWYDENRGWRPVAPLTPIVHRPQVRHAMRTGQEPLLAYFLWRGPGIGERARMSPAGE